MLCTVLEILQHTSCKTLHTVFYIRHVVRKANLMQSLGKHIYLKCKTQLKLEKHTDSHTWKQLKSNWRPISVSHSTTNTPDVSSAPLYLPPYTPSLNPTEFFSAWRWKVYDRQPHAHMPLLQAVEVACGDIEVRSIQGWLRHAKRYFPRYLAREDVSCDVDEVMWPNANSTQDP